MKMGCFRVAYVHKPLAREVLSAHHLDQNRNDPRGASKQRTTPGRLGPCFGIV